MDAIQVLYRGMLRHIGLALVLLLLPWCLQAQGFAGGTGTIEDPYRITTGAQLDSVRFYANKVFVLENDIDLAPYIVSKGTSYGWLPICSKRETDPTTIAFSGKFDGRGHQVTGLTSTYSGLFGYLEGAEIYNLTVKTAPISQAVTAGLSSYNGLLAGHSLNAVIVRCHVEGRLHSPSSNYWVGGLVGWVRGTTINQCTVNVTITGYGTYMGGLAAGVQEGTSSIRNCTVQGSVTTTSSCPVGGIAGQMTIGNHLIEGCQNYMTITATSQQVGGLVGAHKSGIIRRSWNDGTIKGQMAGGLVGKNATTAGILEDCYSTGAVNTSSNTSSSSRAGGLIGVNVAALRNAYAAGAVTGTGLNSNMGGLYGEVTNTATSSHVYYDYETTGRSIVAAVGTSAGGDSSRTTLQMYQKATFTSWAFDSIWYIKQGIDYPRLFEDPWLWWDVSQGYWFGSTTVVSYDGNQHAVQAVSKSGLPTQILYAGNTTPPTNVGSYPLRAQVGRSQPYSDSYLLGTLIIIKGVPRMAWDTTQGTWQGDTCFVKYCDLPSFTPPVTTNSDAVLSYTYGGHTTKPTLVGTYILTAVAPATSNCYTRTITGVLVVQKEEAGLTWDQSQGRWHSDTLYTTYGVADSAKATSLSNAGITYIYTLKNTNVTSTTPPTAVGTYILQAILAEGNCYRADTLQTVLVIRKANAALAWKTTLGTWGHDTLYTTYGQLYSVQATHQGTGTITLTYNNTGTAPATAGTYALKAVLTEGTNHLADSIAGVLIIRKANAALAWNTSMGTWGHDTLYADYNGMTHLASTTRFGNGVITITYNGSTTTPIAAGTYALKAVLSAGTNHLADSIAGVLIIRKAQGTLAWNTTVGTWGHDTLYTTYGQPYSVQATYVGDGSMTTINPGATTAGTYVLKAVLTEGNNYLGDSITGVLVVRKAQGTLAWKTTVGTWGHDTLYTPYGQAYQVQTTATGDGVNSITYNGASAPPLAAGTYALKSVLSEGVNYLGDSITGVLVIRKAHPALAWNTTLGTWGHDTLYTTYGQLYSVQATHLDHGSLAITYNGLVPAPTHAGKYALKAVLDESANYFGDSITGVLLIRKAPTPPLVWASPADIVYGTLLDSIQLNATATLPGHFEYTPTDSTQLNAGMGQVLHVHFTPADSANYMGAEATVAINVLKYKPQVNWVQPDQITIHDTLSGLQLNAQVQPNIAGACVYTPGIGGQYTTPGVYSLRVQFTPSDLVNYDTASAHVPLTVVRKHTPVIVWPTPDTMVVGMKLSAVQLNATLQQIIPGTWEYTPRLGDRLTTIAEHMLSVTFTPTDTLRYYTVSAEQRVVVRDKVQPVIVWTPQSLMQGVALSAAFFDARVVPDVPGRFVYSPHNLGDLLQVGLHEVEVEFIPDQEDYYYRANLTSNFRVRRYLLELEELRVGNTRIIYPNDTSYYRITCDDNVNQLEVEFVLTTGAVSNYPTNNFTAQLLQPGVYRYDIKVCAPDSSDSHVYVLIVTKPFLADNMVVVQKGDAVLIANNNPKTNGGYSFMAYQWYKTYTGNHEGAEYLANGQNYYTSLDGSIQLDQQAYYYAQLVTIKGDTLRTCPKKPLMQGLVVTLYPNPATVFERVNVKIESPLGDQLIPEGASVVVSVYNINGLLLRTELHKTTEFSIVIPGLAGMYMVNVILPGVFHKIIPITLR